MSVFLCIILSAVVLTEGTLYYAARIRGCEADLQRCLRLQISQILCNYNESLLENYGLYGLDKSSVSTKVFDACFFGGANAVPDAEVSGQMTAADLKKAIPDYMKIRMPAIASTEILSRVKGIFSEISSCGVFQKAKAAQTSEWLSYVKDFLGQKDKWSDVIKTVVSAAEAIDVTGKIKDLEEFSLIFQQAMQRSTTLYLQGESDTDMSQDVLNPDNLSYIMEYLDDYMNFDLPGIADEMLINEYAVSFCDSKIEFIKDGESSTPETNLLGTAFTDIHTSNRADLEYILTGFDNETASFGEAKILIYDMRILADFAAYLVDTEKMSKAKEIAEILSTAISVVSAGTVSIDPEILQFAVLYVWALGQGFADMMKLIQGESIILFDHSSLDGQEVLKNAMLTDYRDYLRLFLMAVPTEWKLSRILTILQKDCGNELYTGVRISAVFRGSQFIMEDTYDAYASA